MENDCGKVSRSLLESVDPTAEKGYGYGNYDGSESDGVCEGDAEIMD